MFCKKCGSPLELTDAFCKNCGEPVNAPNPVAESAPLTQPVPTPVETPVVPTPAPSEPVNPVLGGEAVTPVPTAPAQVPVTPTPEPAPMTTPAPTEPATPTVAGTAPTETPKKNKTFIIIAIVLVAIIIVLGGILIAKKFAGKDNVNSNTTNDQNVVNPVNDDNNGQVASNTFEYNEYQLPIPSGYTAEILNSNGVDLLQLLNRKKKILSTTELRQGYTIDAFIDVKDELKSQIEAILGSSVSSVEEKTYSGINWLIYNYNSTSNGITYENYYAYSNVGSYTVSESLISNVGGISKDTIFTDLSNMYKNTTYKGTKNFAPSDNNSDLKPEITTKPDTSIFN